MLAFGLGVPKLLTTCDFCMYLCVLCVSTIQDRHRYKFLLGQIIGRSINSYGILPFLLPNSIATVTQNACKSNGTPHMAENHILIYTLPGCSYGSGRIKVNTKRNFIRIVVNSNMCLPLK